MLLAFTAVGTLQTDRHHLRMPDLVHQDTIRVAALLAGQEMEDKWTTPESGIDPGF
jgi:hypothetical protein